MVTIQDMEDLIEFFLKVGEVKRLKQRGLVLRNVEDPARIGGHSFREALMGWVLAQSSNPVLDSAKVIKMVLLHDLARGYAGDITPYEPLIWKNGEKDLASMYEKWVRIPKKEKERFAKESEKKEQNALKQLLRYLPSSSAKEIETVWKEYHVGISKEARFVYQLHTMENFLQSLEYWKADKNFPIESWWHQMKETTSDPLLVQFIQQLDKYFLKK